jgi:hypothetical protein
MEEETHEPTLYVKSRRKFYDVMNYVASAIAVGATITTTTFMPKESNLKSILNSIATLSLGYLIGGIYGDSKFVKTSQEKSGLLKKIVK